MTTGPVWARPSPTGRQWRWDLAVGVLLTVGVAVSTVLSRSAGIDPGSLRPGPGEELAWALAVGLPLCFRRRFPLSALMMCAVAFIGLQLRFVGDSSASSVCLTLAVYTAGAWSRDRRRATAVRIVVVVALSATLAYALSTDTWSALNGLTAGRDSGPLPVLPAFALYAVGTNVLFLAGAWTFGNAAWVQTRQRTELAERNREVQAERDENARNAVIAERLRIARELHDVVAHHVSVMGVQAGAARLMLTRDPAAVGGALMSIESAGRDAVEEMHRLLGVLRDERRPAQETPIAGVERLATLVEGVRGALRATCTVDGEPRELPQSLSISLYRIAQEALTNTVRHAGASRVDVTLSYRPTTVELIVVDDGQGAAGHTAAVPSAQDARRTGSGRTGSGRARGGLGHIGMRERVALHDGTLQVGPDERGYAVRAWFRLV
ncbi:sensor histidine kinase [Streptomyces sp. NPDC059092]|uniref:sensor histidine kinase n=1 Tax=Streptomyces sp. NPDC059092 TaxID=3346725 RepID=UPI0036C37D6C